MIHIATVHWKTDRWIDVQNKYLRKFVKENFRVYAFINDLENDHSKKFFYTSTEPISEHAIKLNILADVIKFASKDDNDILIFLDGDAFPINNLDSFIHAKVATNQLLAIQRRENNGDLQPHPSFCATTINFWKAMNGDWKNGYLWRNQDGELITDVGGNLLGILKKNFINWYPLLRSNKRNLHPLFFGVYDDIIYHHGAGFREVICRLDHKLRHGTHIEEVVRRNTELSNKVYDMISHNEYFYRDFI